MPDRSFHFLPDTASTYASQLDVLTAFLTIVSVLITLTVFGLIVCFGLRYRRRTEDEVPPKPPARPLLEIGWSVALFALFMVMFVWGTVLYVDSRRAPVGSSVLEIDVVARQWMWKMQHPGGQREINELHVPVGRTVKLVMTSLDVIHSFGVPAFRIKQDVLPDQYTTQWFTATRTGEYHLFCQEYCGADHSQMIGRIVVTSAKDYQAWLAGVPADDPPAIAGARLFVSQGCSTCHGQNAPTLAGLFGRSERMNDGSSVVADETYLRTSILYPPAQIVAGYAPLMPSYRGQLNDEQVDDLVAYIKSLGAARGDALASPTTRAMNGYAPTDMPNVPPTREPPPAHRSSPEEPPQ